MNPTKNHEVVGSIPGNSQGRLLLVQSTEELAPELAAEHNLS